MQELVRPHPKALTLAEFISLTTMRLLLVFLTFAGPMTFMSQFSQQTDNTTKSDRGSAETSGTLNIHEKTNTYGGMEEKATLELGSKRPGDTTTTMTDFSPSDLNQSTTTRYRDTGDSQKVTVNYTTVSNINFLQNVSYDAPTTRQSLDSERVPKVEQTSISTASLSSATADSTSSAAPVSVGDFVSITSADILVCLHGQKTRPVSNTAGQISFARRGFSTNGTCTIEFVAPQGMVIEMFIYLNIVPCFPDCSWNGKCSYLVWLKDNETKYRKDDFICNPLLRRAVSPGHKLQFELWVQQTDASIDLSINFTAVPPPQLQVVFLTPMTGYIQSPDWDGMMNYPSHLNITKQLEIPANHSIMISFQNMDIEGLGQCPYDRLTISVEDNKADGKLWNLVNCNDNLVLKAAVFHTNAILFHFETDHMVEYLGFKLYFSFHSQSEIPEELEDGKWNCSVPYWPKFQLHFNCNKIEECNGGEDEDNCGYSDSRCGKGFFSIDTRCYSFISAKEYVTWNEAAYECIQHESYLASLNNPKEWEKVTESIIDHIREPVYIGLQRSGTTFPYIYRDRYQWTDGSPVFFTNVRNQQESSIAHCSMVLTHQMYIGSKFVHAESCKKNATRSFLCEKNMLQTDGHDEKSQDIVLHPVQWPKVGGNYVTCPSDHVTLTMLACDPQTACWADQYNTLTTACPYPGNPPPPSLQCTSGVDSVPYTLVCDHRPDCSDNSDESFCVFPSCHTTGMFQCDNKQCVPYSKQCDKIPHCQDGSDETNCPLYSLGIMLTPKPPAILYFDGHGSYDVRSLDSNQTQTLTTDICPETHFLCPGNLTYCMPVYVRCNGVYDCPGHEDEDGCDRYQCPGFYHCRASPICVHANHTCDGVFQCPQQDDELLCEATCPQNCSCQGLAFYCHGQFPAEQYPELRFLHAPESGLSHEKLELNSMLIYLTLAKCNLKDFDHVKFPNLRILDLSYNELVSFKTNQLVTINNLQKLSLDGNPLKYLFSTSHDSYLQFSQLLTLDLSSVPLPDLNVTKLTIFPKLQFLNLSGSGVKHISEEGFQPLELLQHLDVRSCPLTEFPKDIFHGLKGLKEIWADNYRLCCQVTLPESFLPKNCHSPSDEISSCDALLRSDFYRVVLSAFAVLALIGNFGSFVYRVFINPKSSNFGFGVFVTHLCVSDFLMGVYLAVIGIADRIYQGNYLWKDSEWKQSTGCKVAGFLSLLSSEVSAFLICLITLDRFIVLQFPFSSLYFKEKSAHIACIIVWFTGTVIAGIPLLPVTEHWNFYSQNGICIPLPVTRNHAGNSARHTYSFSVIIIVNFIIFVLIAVGQLSIYWSIRTNRMSAGDSNKKNNDVVIARRLITIAMSDFLCWFPIGLLGLLASNGMSIHGEVNVAMAIVALPINSAINPFLYTINSLMEKQRKASEQRIRKMIMSTFDSKCPELSTNRKVDNFTQQEALCLISKWLSQNLVSLQNIDKICLDARKKKTMFEERAE